MQRLVAWSSTGLPGQVADLTLTKTGDADEYLRFSPFPYPLPSPLPSRERKALRAQGRAEGQSPSAFVIIPHEWGIKGVEVCH